MVNLNVVGDNISVSIGEDFSVVPYNKVTYQRLFDLSMHANAADSFEEYEMYCNSILEIVDDNGVDAQKLIESRCDYLKYNELTKQYFLTYDNEEVSDIPMPQSLVDRIMDSIDKDIDFLPVVKLWTRFLRNPLLKDKGADFAQRFADFVNMKYVHPENKKIFLDKGLADDVATDLATV